jgi:hypothetical protein
LNSLSSVSSTSLSLESVTRELWVFGRVMLPYIFCFVLLCWDSHICWGTYVFHFMWVPFWEQHPLNNVFWDVGLLWYVDCISNLHFAL